jgi:hypothetical protein
VLPVNSRHATNAGESGRPYAHNLFFIRRRACVAPRDDGPLLTDAFTYNWYTEGPVQMHRSNIVDNLFNSGLIGEIL